MAEQKKSFWKVRTELADKAYKYWSTKFKTSALVKYYEGFHWKDDETTGTTERQEAKYTVNMFFSTIEVKVPSLLFKNPIYRISPKPKSIAIDSESAYASASAREDVLNDWAMNEDNRIADVLEDCIYDAFPRFGIVEVGYSADWIENPFIKKPAYKKDFDVVNGNTVIRTEKVPRNEKLYLKHIPAKNFRVSIPERRYLEMHDWVGYFEYQRVLDLKNDPNLNNTVELTGGYSPTSDEMIDYDQEERDLFKNCGDFTKVWTIYDLRERKKVIWAEESDKILRRIKFKTFPIIDLRFKRRMNAGYYPLPLSFNWISPQNEINESREANRVHRRRFKRMYQVKPNAFVNTDEKDKLLRGEDGTVVEVTQEITAVPNADLGSSAALALTVNKDDFLIVSGSSSEETGQVDRQTATAAAITNNRAKIRENRDQITVAGFLSRVGKTALLLIEENFVNPIYTVSQRHEGEEFLGSVKSVPKAREIHPLTDFGEGMDFDVIVNVDTMSPIANEDELKKFNNFLELLSRYPYFAISPKLVRELAFRTGYRNEDVIVEFQKMAQLQMIGMMQNAKQAAAGAGINPQQAQMNPPNGQQMFDQLRGQGVPLNG